MALAAAFSLDRDIAVAVKQYMNSTTAYLSAPVRIQNAACHCASPPIAYYPGLRIGEVYGLTGHDNIKVSLISSREGKNKGKSNTDGLIKPEKARKIKGFAK